MLKISFLFAVVLAATIHGEPFEENTTSSVLSEMRRLKKAMEIPFEALHLTPTLTACFNWRGFDNQIINFFYDPRNNITINGVLNTKNTQIRSSFKPDHLLYITKLFIQLAKYNLEIMIYPTVAYVRKIGKPEIVMQLPLKDTESYLAKHKGVTFEMMDISTERTTLVVGFKKQILHVVVQLFHPPGKNAFNHMTMLIPKKENFSRKSTGVWGYIRKYSRNWSKWLYIKQDKRKKNASSEMNFNDNWIPITKNRIHLSYADKYMDCWYISDPQLLVGKPLDQFRVNSLIDVPPDISSK